MARKKKQPDAATAAAKLKALQEQNANIQNEIARWTQIAEDARRTELLHILAMNDIKTPDDLQSVFRKFKLKEQSSQDMSDDDRKLLTTLHERNIRSKKNLDTLIDIRDILVAAEIKTMESVRTAAAFYATARAHDIREDAVLDAALSKTAGQC